MSVIGHKKVKEIGGFMTTAVAGLLTKILMTIGSTIKTSNVTAKSKVENGLVETKNWAELNPSFDVPHIEPR
jgi:hypothetical protein